MVEEVRIPKSKWHDFLDGITSIDEKLAKLIEITAKAKEVKKKAKTDVKIFRKDVDPEKEVLLSDKVDYDGTITGVFMHFPAGSENLVEVEVVLGQRSFIPEEGKIALDDAFLRLDTKEEVTKGTPIKVRITNKDTTNSHEISVIMAIVS